MLLFGQIFELFNCIRHANPFTQRSKGAKKSDGKNDRNEIIIGCKGYKGGNGGRAIRAIYRDEGDKRDKGDKTET